jgi:UDP-N-acetylenolpyruvoylglucosamine reductase
VFLNNDAAGKLPLSFYFCAQDFFTPNTLNALSDFLKNNQQPILMLGLGSNLLVRDRGFSALKHLA